MTAAGIILGTAAYMSPEQARGQVVDARTDLWAFGCVLFEMLTSRRPFAGDTVTDLLAAVVKEEPRWDALPADTPAATRKLLRRCLTKDRKRRLASAADARLEVEESLDPALAALAPGPAPAARRSPLFMILGVGVVLAVGTGAYLLGRGATPAPAASAARFIIPAPPGTQIVSGHREVAISADGQQIAFIARGATEQHIYVRRVDDLTPRLIAGTEAARDLTFSPDGRSLAFHSGDTIRKVSLAGGAPTRLADARHTHGLAWRPGEDAIYFAPNNDPGVAIWKVPASGESPAVAVTTLDAAGGEVRHTWPVLSIDGDTLIFTVGDAQGNPAVSTLSLATGARRTMRTDGGAFALTDRSEFLFVRGQLVMRALDGNGPPSAPELLATSAAIRSDNSTGTVALSATGTLAYVPSPDIQRRSLVWIVPDGRLSDASFGARELRGVSLSQDGRRVAMSVGQGQESVLYRADAAGGPLTPLAKPGPAVTSWSPDGRWIAGAMRLADARTSTVARVAVESGGNWEPLLSSENIRGMALWTPDGQGLLLPGMEAGRNQTLLLRLDRTPPEASIVVARPGNVQFASLSPDGRWVAYESDEFGRPEVYVQSYPDPTIRVQVSGGRVTAPNGSWPTWSKAGDALYLQIGGTILRSSVTTDPRLRVGEPRLIVSDPLIVPGSTAEKTFDVAPDGRILAIREDDSVRSDHIVVEQNWLSGVRAPSPEGRE